MNYKGVIIAESLGDKSILDNVQIIETRVEDVTDEHKTPWLARWTLHTVEFSEEQAGLMAELISHSFDKEHPNWYADFKNDKFHYIIFADKFFKVDLQNPVLYKDAHEYGVSIGIPEYQLDFVAGG